MVFVDETYFEYVDNPTYASMMELVCNRNKNIIIAITASKIHTMTDWVCICQPKHDYQNKDGQNRDC